MAQILLLRQSSLELCTELCQDVALRTKALQDLQEVWSDGRDLEFLPKLTGKGQMIQSSSSHTVVAEERVTCSIVGNLALSGDVSCLAGGG